MEKAPKVRVSGFGAFFILGAKERKGVNRKVHHLVACGLMAALAISSSGCKRSRQQGPSQETAAATMAAPSLPAPRDPADVKGWIALGNSYFDSHQRLKAVEAYGRALALEPNNPDVLTDQGVMYRELDAYDKAAANFRQASHLDPRHAPSLLNLGVLYAQDFHDEEKALATFGRLIQVAPDSPQAARARQYVQQIQQADKSR